MEAAEILVAVAAANAYRELLYDENKRDEPIKEIAITTTANPAIGDCVEPIGPDPKLTMTPRIVRR